MKKSLKYLCFLIGATVFVLLFDYWLVLTFHTNPIFAVKQQDDENEIYTALWYRVWKCQQGDIVRISSLDSKYTCPLVEEETLKIIDESTSCDTAMELFYEDELFEYYFPCKKSENMFIQFEDDSISLLVNALTNDQITIDELLQLDFEYLKVPKFEIKITEAKGECLVDEYFKDILTPKPSSLYTYCVDDIFVAMSDKQMHLSDALKNQDISLEDIVYYLDYGNRYAEGSKTTVQDGSYVYENNNLTLVQCNTFLQNSSYYFAPPKTKYQEFYCK